MHFQHEQILPAQQSAEQTAPEEGLDFLLKNFTIAIGALVGISALTQLLISLFSPGM